MFRKTLFSLASFSRLPRNANRYLRIVSMLIFLALLSTPLAAVEIYLLGGDATPTTELVIGESLSVTVTELNAESQYSLDLLDDQNSLVATVHFLTDDEGEAGPILLWGGAVTGCDATALPGYPTRAAAEGALDGMEMTVELYDAGDNFVESTEISMVVGTERTVTWVDASGCPRTRLDTTEPLYLEIDRATPGEVFYVSLVALPDPAQMACGEDPIRSGQPLHDPRGGAGPTIITADTSGFLHVQLWATPTSGYYGLLLSDSPFEPLVRPGDALPLTSMKPWTGGGTHGVHVEEPCVKDVCPD